MQNLIRECWVGANGKEWKSQEHIDGEYKALCKGNSLKAKSEGLSKMFKEMGPEKLNEAIWEVYVAWPVDGDTTDVTRWNRKKHAAGDEVTQPRTLMSTGSSSLTIRKLASRHWLFGYSAYPVTDFGTELTLSPHIGRRHGQEDVAPPI